jgi:hypothetical protein
MAARLEVIYRFKSILISQILFGKFQLQFSFSLTVIYRLIKKLMKNVSLII